MEKQRISDIIKQGEKILMGAVSWSFFNTMLILCITAATADAHLCDNVFRQKDRLIVKPENYNMVVKDKAAFKIFLQNNMDREIAEIGLLAESPAFDFEIKPDKMSLPVNHKVFFTVTMRSKPEIETGTYPINFRLIGGDRQFKSFTLEMQQEAAEPKTSPEAPEERVVVDVGQINVKVDKSHYLYYYWHIIPILLIIIFSYWRYRRAERPNEKK